MIEKEKEKDDFTIHFELDGTVELYLEISL